MDELKVAELCKAIIEPLLSKLASKDDIDHFVQFIEGQFKDELQSRDVKISALESRIVALETALVTSKDVENRVEKLEAELDRAPPASDSFDYAFPTDTIEADRAKLDMLLIGDSNVRFLDANAINPGKVNKIDCTGGASITDIRTNLIDLNNKFDIEKAVIHVGGNHIPREEPHDLADNLISLLKAAKAGMPNTKLFFSAMFPRCRDSFLPGINMVNELVYEACGALDIGFIQHPRLARYGFTNYRLFGRDRIHLNPRGQLFVGQDVHHGINK